MDQDQSRMDQDQSRMDQDQSRMERRLDDVLSRIAMETQEIKELEQQLTDGQILANEALKKDLEGIICGLQQYLSSLRAQTSQAQQKAQSLQAENQSLRRHLQDTQRHCRLLEEQATAHTKLMSAQQDDLRLLRSEADSLRDTQVQVEAELQHLRAELNHQLGQDDRCLLQPMIHRLQTRLQDSAPHRLEPYRPLRVEDLSQSKSLSDGHRRNLCRLNRKLQKLRRVMCESDSLRGEQLLWAVDQLKELNLTVERLKSDGHRRNLCRLNRKLQKLRRVMCESDSLRGEQLLWAVDQLKELNLTVERLKSRSKVGETQDELTKVQPEVDQTKGQTRTTTRSTPGTETRSRPRPSRETREGPPSCGDNSGLKDLSVGSGAAQDSGLDLDLLSSPERAPPAGAAGNLHRPHHRETDPSEEDSLTLHCLTAAGPAGGALSQVCPLTAAGPAGGAVSQVCPLTAAGPAGGAVSQVCPLTADDQRCLCRRLKTNGVQDERTLRDKQRDRLRSETEELQRTLRRHRRVLGVCEELCCVEQTLLRRRAELRQTQRLLQEAHSSATQARCEAEDWEHRARDSATCLQQTQLHLRELQDEVEVLRKTRQDRIQDHRDLTQSPDLDPALSPSLDSQNQLESLRIQEQLRNQETRLKSSLQFLVQQGALLSQSSSLVSATAEEELKLQSLQSELDSNRAELKRVLEELLSERQELLRLKTLRSRDLQQSQDQLDRTKDQLDQTRTELDQTKDQLDQSRTELDQTKDQLDQTRTELDQTKDQLDQSRTELDQTKDQLDQTRTELDQTKDQLDQSRTELDQTLTELDQTMRELLMKQDDVKQKEEELEEKQKALDQSQDTVDRKRAALTKLQQEVETHRKEAESRLKETERQRRELQEVKEEVGQREEQSSRLQQECRHLEDRRRHATRCLSAVEAELHKLKQEQSQSLRTQQEVMQEAAANQEKLKESSELLCFLGEKLKERTLHLQTLDQELAVLSVKHRQRQTELQELEKHNLHTQACAAVTQSEHRGRCVTQEQLHKLSEELWEREQQLLEREAGLRQKEEGLKQKEEELSLKKEELKQDMAFKQKGEELLQKEEELQSEDSDGASSGEFYLSTAGLRSASSPEVHHHTVYSRQRSLEVEHFLRPVEERRRVELETDRLRLRQDSLTARLRCSLQTQDQTLQDRGLETEQSVRGLRDRVDRLDSLLLRDKRGK